jgi:hypothetical protein
MCSTTLRSGAHAAFIQHGHVHGPLYVYTEYCSIHLCTCTDPCFCIWHKRHPILNMQHFYSEYFGFCYWKWSRHTIKIKLALFPWMGHWEWFHILLPLWYHYNRELHHRDHHTTHPLAPVHALLLKLWHQKSFKRILPEGVYSYLLNPVTGIGRFTAQNNVKNSINCMGLI